MANAVEAYSPINVAATATISSGQSLSAAVSLVSGKPAGVQLPSNVDSATSLTFQVSYDGGVTYNNFYDSTEYTVTVAASRSCKINYADFVGATHMKVRLGTAGSPTTATADRTLTFSLVP